MRIVPDLTQSRQAIRNALQGPQVLAFLPALCLAAYWGGGEILLVLCALLTPVLYAATGGFDRLSQPAPAYVHVAQRPEDIARVFLETAHRNGQTTACFQIQAEGLIEIARELGDEAAQDARQQLKVRLKSALRESDCVFTTGDTRLVALIAPGFRLKLDGLLDIAQRLRSTAEDPMPVSGTTRYLSVSIGIASSLGFGRTATSETWLAASAQALGLASANGPSATRVWSEKLSRECQARVELRSDLENALKRGEFTSYFQPQVSVRSGRVSGMEALARWNHPTRGILEPSEFLPTLMDSGQMDGLGIAIVRQGLSALQTWDKDGFDVPSVSVNFSAAELRNPHLVDAITQELDSFGFTAKRLVIEILESVAAVDGDDIIKSNLAALSELGCRIDMDDFGTGHTSITTLRNLPVGRLKIDRSYVKDIDTRDDKKRMLAAILGMAEQLDLEVTAEGVETLSENSVLRDLNCNYAQGFLYGCPQSVTETTAWLSDFQSQTTAGNAASLRRVK